MDCLLFYWSIYSYILLTYYFSQQCCILYIAWPWNLMYKWFIYLFIIFVTHSLPKASELSKTWDRLERKIFCTCFTLATSRSCIRIVFINVHRSLCVHFGLIVCRVPVICLLQEDEHVYVPSYSQFAWVLVILSFVFFNNTITLMSETSYNDFYVKCILW